MTYSQFHLYLKALGQDQLRELRERAIAARAAGATKKDWKKFMEAVSGRDREKEHYATQERTLQQAKKRKVKSLEDEDGIEWQKI